MSFASGQTVYDASGKAFEYHHEHAGVVYVYPIFECEDPNGGYYDVRGEHMVGLSKVFAEPPRQKLADTLIKLYEEIAAKKDEAANLRKEIYETRGSLDGEKKELARWRDEFGALNMIGRMMDGQPVVMLIVKVHEWTPPEAAGTREAAAVQLRYDPSKKAWRFAKPRRGTYAEGHDHIEIFNTVDEANTFVSAAFDALCGKVRTAMAGDSIKVFSESYTHTTPHICKLREWVKAWPHLSIPEDILIKEEQSLRYEKEKQIEAARLRLEALQNG